MDHEKIEKMDDEKIIRCGIKKFHKEVAFHVKKLLELPRTGWTPHEIDLTNKLAETERFLMIVHRGMKELKKLNKKKHDAIEGELMGAERYYKRWQETHDKEYLKMAHDETRHAQKLITEAKLKIGGDKKKEKHIHDMVAWHDKIVEKIEIAMKPIPPV